MKGMGLLLLGLYLGISSSIGAEDRDALAKVTKEYVTKNRERLLRISQKLSTMSVLEYQATIDRISSHYRRAGDSKSAELVKTLKDPAIKEYALSETISALSDSSLNGLYFYFAIKDKTFCVERGADFDTLYYSRHTTTSPIATTFACMGQILLGFVTLGKTQTSLKSEF
jgi:hypothetical protein